MNHFYNVTFCNEYQSPNRKKQLQIYVKFLEKKYFFNIYLNAFLTRTATSSSAS